jgi:hypothetical protein
MLPRASFMQTLREREYSKKEDLGRITYFDNERIENDASNNSALPRERLYRVIITYNGRGSNQSQSYLRPTVSRPVCSVVRPRSATRDQFFFFFHGNYLEIFAVLIIWCALSDERTGLQITRTSATGSCQRCHS